MENSTAAEVDVIPQGVRIVNSFILTAITVVGIAGNTLVFIAYCLSRRLQTKSNIFVINLATADFLTCLSLPVITFFLLLDVDGHTKPWMDILCTIDFGAFGIFVQTSFMTLAFIAVNRYVLITKSQKTYKWLYQRKFVFIFLCVSWLCPTFLVTLPLVFGALHIGYDENLHACGALTDHPESHQIYNLISFCITIIQITMIVYSYGRIYLFLRRHNKKILEGKVKDRLERNAENKDTRRSSKHQVDITKNLFYILVSFFICITPFVISEILDAHYLVKLYTSLFLIFNSCVNPILYGVKHPHFRQVFYNILTRQWAEIPEPAFRWMISAKSSDNNLDLTSMPSSGREDPV